ncbi:YlcI/YnfO family protein [Caldimonas tepidiphila]|uniref:YlcI/YnfO family protein n=1 Tax=Caldimonas tepidiphila TaxID=2315841 RepID=UPI000E5B31D4|nr:YlcI/YnfO family protein [Caldimonas tepidiphila]
MSEPQSFPVPGELCAAVRQVLREGESLAAFVEAAVRQQLERRRAPAAESALVPEPAPPAGRRHAADELLGQLDAWLRDVRPLAAPAPAASAGGSPAR